MKALLVTGVLWIGLAGQALSMGHPHNLFAARKQMRAKATVLAAQPKRPAVPSQPLTTCAQTLAFGKRLLTALLNARPARLY